jgi:hypothetical protein
VKRKEVEVLEVDDISLMGPWRLRKHLNLRHVPAGDFSPEVGGDFFIKRRPDVANDAALRTYHERCHREKEYDHDHS